MLVEPFVPDQFVPQTESRTPITVAYGDGIGPEITYATLRLMEKAGANILINTIELGEDVYASGHSSGITPEAWDRLRHTKVFLKAPVATPRGKGVKSINVTIRKALGLFANLRPAQSYHPFIETKHPNLDIVVIRENEEDLYGGIEHQQTQDVVQCLKLTSRTGCERIVRFAFEYAVARGRKTVTCMVKDNIMKMTDGLFREVFDEIALEYPGIVAEHRLVDIGIAEVATNPENFDVIVLPNLYGDILSDVTAHLKGSVGLAPSANIGEQIAMFEPVHGSAPFLAGKNVANPSGMILAGVKMLAHINQVEVAERIHNAWLKTIEDGIHTADIYGRMSRHKVGTAEFAAAVIDRLGAKPAVLTPKSYLPLDLSDVFSQRPAQRRKELVGVDVFVDWPYDLKTLARRLNVASGLYLDLKMITNRGIQVWPQGFPETFHTDHWRCRFEAKDDVSFTHYDLTLLLSRIEKAGLDFIKIENLYTFDGLRGYSLGQGQ
ncbi:MAG: NADP-dependent isocitrate dehydrogenase [Chloroflexota bacterium]